VLNHLNNAMEGATRAAALTRRLLSFARSEPLLPERVDPTELVSGMSDLLDRTLGERVHVEVDLAPDTWPTYVDSHQLENAIVNLAVNARDAMEGRGILRITTNNATLGANEVGDIRAGDYVRVSVSDTGSGMTPEVLERAFEPFFTTKPVGKGTGLGLTVGDHRGDHARPRDGGGDVGGASEGRPLRQSRAPAGHSVGNDPAALLALRRAQRGPGPRDTRNVRCGGTLDRLHLIGKAAFRRLSDRSRLRS
jgi:hypothetical protein